MAQIKGTRVMYATNHGEVFHCSDGPCVNLKLCCGYKSVRTCELQQRAIERSKLLVLVLTDRFNCSGAGNTETALL